jgi:hypothetical protein
VKRFLLAFQVVTHFSTPSFIDDPCIFVQEETLGIIRNLTCIKPEDIDLVISNVQAPRLFSLIKTKLSVVLHATATASTNTATTPQAGEQIAIHCLYIVAHVACGEDRHKWVVLEDTQLLLLIKDAMVGVCVCWWGG